MLQTLTVISGSPESSECLHHTLHEVEYLWQSSQWGERWAGEAKSNICDLLPQADSVRIISTSKSSQAGESSCSLCLAASPSCVWYSYNKWELIREPLGYSSGDPMNPWMELPHCTNEEIIKCLCLALFYNAHSFPTLCRRRECRVIQGWVGWKSFGFLLHPPVS